MLLLVVNLILMLIFLNSFVINLVSFPLYVNLAHFVLRVFCFRLFFVLLNLFKTETSSLLFFRICFYVLNSFILFILFSLYVFILLVKYLIAASLYSRGWHESLGMIVSVAVGFLCISNVRLFTSLVMVISRKLISFPLSFSKANFILGIMLLKALRMSYMK